MKKIMIMGALLISMVGGILTPAAKTHAAATKAEYVIITTKAISSQSTELNNFAAQKRSEGITTEIITEDIWGGGTGDNAANNIRRWLKSNYLEKQIQYVLLVGDPNPDNGAVPMKRTYPVYEWDSNGKLVFREIPTDYYYADLTGNWDLDNDGLYGEFLSDYKTGGADNTNEVLVGRIPYYGVPSDLDKILRKTINYRLSNDLEWRKKVLMAMNPLAPGVLNYEVGEAITNNILKPLGYKTGDYKRIHDATNPAPEVYPCTWDNVKNTWSTFNPGYVFFSAHGNQTFADEIMDSNGTTALNDAKPSIVFGTSCDIATPENSNSLSYRLLLNGAVAVVSSTRMSHWGSAGVDDIPGNLDINNGIGYEFTKNLLKEGKCVAKAYEDILKDYPITNNYMWRNVLEYNIYGDPALNYYQHVMSKVNNTYTPYTVNGKPYCLEYNTATGDVRFNQITNGGRDYRTLDQAKWTLGWTTIMPYSVNGEPYFLLYKNGTGDLKLVRLLENGTEYQTVKTSSVGTGWTSFMPYTVDGENYFLAYKASTGEVHFDKFAADGKSYSIKRVLTWGKGWTHLIPYTLDGEAYFIAYNKDNGDAHFDKIISSGSNYQILKAMKWATGWTNIMMYRIEDEPYMLVYNGATGAMHFDKIFSDGTNYKILSTDNKGTGWTTFMPFDINEKPYFFAHNKATGELHYDCFTSDGSKNLILRVER